MGKLICELMPVSSYLSNIVSFIAYGFIEYEDKRDAEVSLIHFTNLYFVLKVHVLIIVVICNAIYSSLLLPALLPILVPP